MHWKGATKQIVAYQGREGPESEGSAAKGITCAVDATRGVAKLQEVMKFSRITLAAILTLVPLAVMVGCEAPGKVISPLPPPIVHTPPPPVAPPPPPPPTPWTGPKIRGAVIVIDPGHGGKDPGALPKYRGQMAEEAIVLDISNRVGRLLGERGARVIMTRTSDRFLELQDRADIAERNRADLFVSIHADSAERKSASGAGVHIYTQASSQSQKAALRMVSAFNRAGIECRGVFRNNYHVLREHSRPAMLIECGFLTNPGDARNLNSAGYRAKIADAIADGIASYFAQ